MICIIGIAGSGKNTQADLLTERLKWPNVDAGTLLRQKATGKARQQLDAGLLVDDDVTIKLLTAELKRVEAGRKPFILVGSPRSMEQAHWIASLADSDEVKVEAVFHLSLDKATATKRLAGRGRADDKNEEVIDHRFAEYDNRMGPVIKYLKQRGIKVIEVDARPPIEAVYKQIVGGLDEA